MWRFEWLIWGWFLCNIPDNGGFARSQPSHCDALQLTSLQRTTPVSVQNTRPSHCCTPMKELLKRVHTAMRGRLQAVVQVSRFSVLEDSEVDCRQWCRCQDSVFWRIRSELRLLRTSESLVTIIAGLLTIMKKKNPQQRPLPNVTHLREAWDILNGPHQRVFPRSMCTDMAQCAFQTCTAVRGM